MKIFLSFFLSSFLFLSALNAATIAKGYVYEDRNGNGKKDRSEKGIAGVAVSNGTAVVLTDPSGLYHLPVGDDNIIFLIKPSGYKLRTNENNLPQFYYIHKPKGSPATLQYKGVSPTGPLPAFVNFGLIPDQTNDNFKVLVMADPQPYDQRFLNYLDKGVVSELEGVQGIRFGLCLGDMVAADLNLLKPYTEVVKKIPVPWYNVMGNHDMNMDATADSLTDETFEALFGPANYSFNEGKVHFIVLDNILYPDPRGDAKENSLYEYWAGFREDQLTFIANDLKYVPKDHLVVLAFHSPLDGGYDSFRADDRRKLFALLKDFPYTLSLSGHTHLQNQFLYTKAEGWLQEKPHYEYNVGTASGGWYTGEFDAKGTPEAMMGDGTPKGYAFVTFKGNQFVIDYKAAGKPDDYQIALFLPKVIPHGRPYGRGVLSKMYANFFMGHARDTVQYRIDGGPWKSMTFTQEADPRFLDQQHRWDFTDSLMPGRRPMDAVPSTHLWKAGFPQDLSLGTHTVDIKATDRFGRDFFQTGQFRVDKLP